MLQWIQMGSKERQWAKWASLGGFFSIHYTIPWIDLLEEFLHTWESTKDKCIKTIVCGENITIDQTLITQQFGISVEGVVDAVNALVKKAQVALKSIAQLDANQVIFKLLEMSQ